MITLSCQANTFPIFYVIIFSNISIFSLPGNYFLSISYISFETYLQLNLRRRAREQEQPSQKCYSKNAYRKLVFGIEQLLKTLTVNTIFSMFHSISCYFPYFLLHLTSPPWTTFLSTVITGLYPWPSLLNMTPRFFFLFSNF